MRALVVGSGAREHALALALARTVDVVVQRPEAERCPFVGPVPGGQRIDASSEPPEAIEADLVVVGPEEPLVAGLADRLRALGRLVLGPGAAGAVLEGSKAAMKRLLAEAKVPTARFGIFDDLAEAKAFLRELPGPFVVKTDGLAAGKGVLVTEDPAEAEADLAAKLSGAAFGDAGRTVVVEEGLSGREVSLMVLTDGTRVVPLPPARDAKRLLDGDQGPNTGGMGAYSPVPDFEHRTQDQVLDQIVEPILAALRRRAVDYRGVLYVGLMLTVDGPMVLELNVRLGDPEAQVVLPRVPEDLAGLFAEAASGRLRSDPRPSPDAAVGVVLAAPGYPRAPETGGVLEGLEEAAALPGVTVLHGATARGDDGRVRATGGRVLTLVGQGPDLGQARARAYEALATVHLPGGQWRTDIARPEEEDR
ncbi:phosphoribosylamine--glycine ligase [Aciditerrimonas ferrireducens]|uniref:Phosphoribosylamine--glycine ligase n=1 Tax=Aciditerrimonas ferrireducens TaxID=667306 RepID=A0ABV6C123_9ACTN